MSTTLRYARFASDSTKKDTSYDNKKEVNLRTEEREKMMAERERHITRRLRKEKRAEEKKKKEEEDMEEWQWAQIRRSPRVLKCTFYV